MAQLQNTKAEELLSDRFQRTHLGAMLVIAALLIFILAASIALAVHHNTSLHDSVILLAAIIASLVALFIFLLVLLKRTQTVEERFYRLSNYDTITNLFNRNFFFTYFSAWVAKHPKQDVSFGLLFIDIDNFKDVNDSAGHDKGDRLLRIIAEFFWKHTLDKDGLAGIHGITARIGGDEFLQIVPGISSADELGKHALTLLNAFAEHKEIAPHVRDHHIGLSIGGALFPSQAHDCDVLIKLADIAMYQSKRSGKNKYSFYDTSMGDGTPDMVLAVRTKRSAVDPNAGSDDKRTVLQ